MNRYEVRKNTGWNTNIKGLWVVVADGWQRILSVEEKGYANRICFDLNASD